MPSSVSTPASFKRTPSVPLGVQWNEHKAGLSTSEDRERIARTVAQAARGGRFYANEARKERHLTDYVATVRTQASAAPWTSVAADAALAAVRARRRAAIGCCDASLAVGTDDCSRDVRKGRPRVIVCVDFDCFFAAVEALDNPALRGVPHAVGGPGRNWAAEGETATGAGGGDGSERSGAKLRRQEGGVLSTSSYEARRYGVRSAMPLFIARRLCPQLVVVPARYERYAEVSQLVGERVFARYDANYEMTSLDEALIDMTDFVRLSGRSVPDVVSDMRAEVREVTGGLTVSCGVGCTRLLAKIGADIHKPDGQFLLRPDEESVDDFMSKLPIRKITGIGKVTERLLKDAFDVTVAGDLLEKRAKLQAVLRPRTFDFLIHAAHGLSTGMLERSPGDSAERKGMSRETTFRPTKDVTELRASHRALCERLSQDVLKQEGLDGGRTLTVKLKMSDFRVRTRSRTVPFVVGRDIDKLQRLSWTLLESELPGEVRLLGVRLTGLCGPAYHGGKEDAKQGRIIHFVSPVKNYAVGSTETALAAKDPKSGQEGSSTEFKMVVALGGSLVRQVLQKDQQDNVMQCPVCGDGKFSRLSELNMHVDRCLKTRPVLQGSQMDSAKSGFKAEQSRSLRRKTNIRNYFTKAEF